MQPPQHYVIIHISCKTFQLVDLLLLNWVCKKNRAKDLTIQVADVVHRMQQAPTLNVLRVASIQKHYFIRKSQSMRESIAVDL